MDEDSLLLAGIEDKIGQAINHYTITNSRFLDIRQRTLAESICKKHKELKVLFFGGYPEAERTVAVFLPDTIKAENLMELAEYFKKYPHDNPLALLGIGKDSYSTLGHRDYLGSVMALGIKREMLGDILVREDGCDIVLLKSVAKFLLDNLQKAGRGTLNAELKDIDKITVPPQKTEDLICTVASIRLDSITGAAYNVSRTLSAEAINKGLVFINGLQTQKADAKVEPGDKIVFRGKGKVIVKEILGETKKGRLKILIQKFI